MTRGELRFLGQSIDALAPQRARPARHRPGARGPPRVRAPDARREPGRRLGGARQPRTTWQRNRDRVYSYFPRLHERRSARSRATCRAASSRCSRSAAALMTQPEAADARRAEPRARPVPRRRDLRDRAPHQPRGRPVGAAGRAERGRRARGRLARLPDGERPHRDARQRRGDEEEPRHPGVLSRRPPRAATSTTSSTTGGASAGSAERTARRARHRARPTPDATIQPVRQETST